MPKENPEKEVIDFRVRGTEAIKNVMDKYASVAGDWFTIKDDGDTAKVRFQHGDDSDLDIFVVHKVQIAGKDKYIVCLSSVGMECPLCADPEGRFRPSVKIFLSLEDGREDGKVKIWDRGRTEIPNILGLIGRYGRLDGRYYDIMRHGKPKSTDTTYQFFPMDPIPEKDYKPSKRESIIGPNSLILQKTTEELKAMMNEIHPLKKRGEATNYQAQPPSDGTGGKGRMF